MKNLEVFKAKILDLLNKSPFVAEVKHAELVHKWVLRLKPDADEALQIASFSHDIDRAITGITEKDLKDYSKIDQFKQEHAIRSARFIEEIMRKEGYDNDIIDKVKYLVTNHEVGGDIESDILRNADSLAYFEYNVPLYMERNGKDRAKGKIQFMYKRIPTDIRLIVKTMKYDDEEIEKFIHDAINEIK